MLKVFHKISEPSRRNAFLAEIGHLRSLNHPAITRIFDEGIFNADTGMQYPFAVIEFVPVTARTLLVSKQIDRLQAIRIALNCLSAIHCLHAAPKPLIHQSVRITEKHYAPWVKARQEQLEADVRRTWPEDKSLQEAHGGYTEQAEQIIPFKSRRKNGGGGGSRTPVRKALRAEDYMLSSVQFFSPAALRMSKKRSRLVRWFSPSLTDRKA